MATVNSEIQISSLRGGGSTAGPGDVGALQLSGTTFTYGVVNAPPSAAAEAAGVDGAGRSLQAFNPPGSPGAGPGQYVWIGQRIFCLTSPPNWTLDLLVSLQSSGNSYGGNSGLHVVYGQGGSAWICGMAPAQAGGVVVVRSDLNDRSAGWTEIGFTGVSTPSQFVGGKVYQQKLWACSGAAVYSFDPMNGVFAEETADPNPGSAATWSRLIESHGRLFWIGTVAGTMYLNERIGGSWIRLHSFGTNSHSSSAFGAVALPVNEQGIVTFHYESSGGSQGIRCFVHRLVIGQRGSATLVDATDPVVPTTGIVNWRYSPTGFAASGCNFDFMWANEDQSLVIPSQRLVYFTTARAGTRQGCVWNGSLATMTPLATTLFGDHTFNTDDEGHTHRTFTMPFVHLFRVDKLASGNLRAYLYVLDNAPAVHRVRIVACGSGNGSLVQTPMAYSQCYLVPGSEAGSDPFGGAATIELDGIGLALLTGRPLGGSPAPAIYSVEIQRMTGPGSFANQRGWTKFQASFY